MKSFTLLRHGESLGNAQGKIQGQLDTELTPKGRLQAESLANYWLQTHVRFDKVITSPLVRAAETANVVSNRLVVPIELDPIWMERSFGELEGALFEEIRQSLPEAALYHPYTAPVTNAESVTELYIRACQAVQKIASLPDGSYLVVSHGAFLNMVMCTILGIFPLPNRSRPRFMFDNTGFAHLTYEDELQCWRMWKFSRADGHMNNQHPD
jgi:broad specificity phosphatase PhoE